MTKINPLWTAYNAVMNDGGEGYNPHPQYIGETAQPMWASLGDQAYRLQRIISGTSNADPRYTELTAELAVVQAAAKDANERNI